MARYCQAFFLRTEYDSVGVLSTDWDSAVKNRQRSVPGLVARKILIAGPSVRTQVDETKFNLVIHLVSIRRMGTACTAWPQYAGWLAGLLLTVFRLSMTQSGLCLWTESPLRNVDNANCQILRLRGFGKCWPLAWVYALSIPTLNTTLCYISSHWVDLLNTCPSQLSFPLSDPLF